MGVGASNDGKWIHKSEAGYGSNSLPNRLFGSRKLVETGTSFYIGTIRLVKLVGLIGFRILSPVHAQNAHDRHIFLSDSLS